MFGIVLPADPVLPARTRLRRLRRPAWPAPVRRLHHARGARRRPRLAARIGVNRVVAARHGPRRARAAPVRRLHVDTPYVVLLVPDDHHVGRHGACAMSSLTGSIMSAVPLGRAGVGSAMNDTTRELGGALGVAVLGSLVASRYDSQIISGAIAGLPASAHAVADSGLSGALTVGNRSAGRRAPTSRRHGPGRLCVGHVVATLVGAIVAAHRLGDRLSQAALDPAGTGVAGPEAHPATVGDELTVPRSSDAAAQGRGRPVPSSPVIDVRRLRTDLAGVKAAMARRPRPELLGAARRRRRARSGSCGSSPPSATTSARQVNELSKQVGRLRRGGRRRRRPRRPGREPRARRREADVARRGRRRRGRAPRPAAAHPEPPARRRARRHERAPTTSWSRTVGYEPGRLRRPPAGAALGDRRRARHPRQRAGRQDHRVDVHDAARPRRHPEPGACASSPSTATPTPSRRSARRRSSPRPRSRPPASCRSSPTTPTPSSATTCGASPPPRCRSRRSARDEVLDEAELPMRIMASTPCYRREAGSAGRDTRGMLRAHEFDKVEILAFATPEQAPALLDELLARAEAPSPRSACRTGIIEICTGDLGQSHHRSFDIEVYAPGLRPVAGGQLGVVVQRLPGPPGQHPLPARRGARAPRSCTR